MNERLLGGDNRYGGDGWIYVTDDGVLPEGGMMPVYPLGVHVLLARVGGSVYALPENASTWPARSIPAISKGAFLPVLA